MAQELSPTHSQTQPAFEYDAFICYRTSRIPDGPVGEALQTVLESYPVPAPLKRNIVQPKRFRSRLRVFRDTTDLNAVGDLSDAIKERLRVSRWLVVVCSPDTPRSDYCNEEVRYFEALHGRAKILFLLIAGEPNESFPTFASVPGGEAADARGQPENQALAADVRAPDVEGIVAKLHGRGVPKSAQARFKILAPILGCASPDVLIQRHRARVRRLTLQIAAAALVVGIGTGWIVSAQIEQEAIRSEAEQLLAEMGLEDRISVAEVDALWRVTSRPRAVRLSFLEQAARIHPRRFNRRAEMMTRAVVGVDSSMADAVEEKILGSLAPRNPSDTDAATTRALLGLHLSVTDAEFLVAAYETLLSQPVFHDVRILEEDPASVSNEGTLASRALGYEFWSRIRSLDETAAKSAVSGVLRKMKSLKDPVQLLAWAALLRELKWVPVEDLRAVTTQVLKAVEGPEASSGSDRTSEILEPYVALWKSARAPLTQDDVESFAPLLIADIQHGGSVIGIEGARDLFIDLVTRTTPTARATALSSVLDAMKTGNFVSYLDEVLVSDPSQLTRELRAERVSVLLGLLLSGRAEEGPSSAAYRASEFARLLARFPEDLAAEDISRAQARLLPVIPSIGDPTGVGGSSDIAYTTEAIAAISRPFSPSVYWQVASDITNAMKKATTEVTSVSLDTIAGAATKMPRPPGMGPEAARVHATILEQIERIDLDKLFFERHLHDWLTALHAFGGEFPASQRERLAGRLLSKLASTRDSSDADEWVEALIDIGVSGETAGRVVHRIIDVYEASPSDAFHLIHNSGLQEWRPPLSAEMYQETLARIAGVIRKDKRAARDMLLLSKAIRVAGESAAPAATRAAWAEKAGILRGLDGLTRARLLGILHGRPPVTRDIGGADLLSALRENMSDGKQSSDLVFPEDDRARVVRTIVSAVESGTNRETCFENAELLLSIPYALEAGDRLRATGAVWSAFEKATTETESERGAQLLSKISGGLDHRQSERIVGSSIGRSLKSDEGATQPVSFASLSISLSKEAAGRFSEQIIGRIGNAEDEWSLGHWYRMLEKLNHTLSDEQRHRAALPVLAELRKLVQPSDPEETYADRHGDLIKWLQMLAQIPGEATADDRREAARLTSAVLASSSYVVEYFPQQPTEVIALLKGADERSLLELLKLPTLEGGSRRALLALLEDRAKQSFRNDVWNAARWAQSAGLDVFSAPSR